MTFTLTIAALDEVRFLGEADSVTVPGREGEMTILAHHEPLLTALKAGTVTVRSTEGEQQFAIAQGTLEVSKEGVSILLS